MLPISRARRDLAAVIIESQAPKSWSELLRTSNPVWQSEALSRQAVAGEAMTIDGALNKTGILLLCLVVAARLSWPLYRISLEAFVMVLVFGTFIAAVIALITVFQRQSAPAIAPVYAVVQGTVIGALSGWQNSIHHEITAQVVFLTVGILAAMLLIYRSRAISVTEKLYIGVASAAVGLLFCTWPRSSHTGLAGAS